MSLSKTISRGSVGMLVLGDVAALLVFIGVGLANHDMTDNVVGDVLRIGAPFLMGWFVSALLLGAYKAATFVRPGEFMLRSVLAWLTGISLALLLRNTIFGEDFSGVFAIISFVFTGLFLLGWRTLFTWRTNR